MNNSKFSNIILLFTIVAFIFLISYTYSNVEYLKVNYNVNILYTAFIFGVISCIILLVTNSKLKFYVSLTIFYIVFSAYSINAIIYYLFVRGDADEVKKIAIKENVNYDDRTRYEVLRDYRNTGINAYASMNAIHWEQDGIKTSDGRYVFPVSGIPNAFTVYCNESGYFAKYLSDKHGFNNVLNVFERLNDIVLIGDSFTEGACEYPSDNVSGQLEKYGWKVANLGKDSNGPLINMATIREYGFFLSPKTVLYLYYEGNELTDLELEYKSSHWINYFDSNYTQKLLNKNNIIENLLKDFHDQLYVKHFPSPQASEFTLSHFIKLRWLRRQLNPPKYKISTKTKHLFKKMLLTTKNDIKKWGGRLYVVYLPSYTRINNNLDDSFMSRNEVLKTLKQLDINVIDFLPTIVSLQDPLSIFPFRRYAHYNKYGYELLASRINEYFKK